MLIACEREFSLLTFSYSRFLFHVVIVQESDLHTKRTGHAEFVDKTSESAKPISLEAPKANAESDEHVDASTSSQSEGTFVFYNIEIA